MTDRSNFLCLDCGVDTGHTDQYYMIHDELWLSVNPGRKGMLCFSCLENRLGRRLTLSDFTDCPLSSMLCFLVPFLRYQIERYPLRAYHGFRGLQL